MSTTTEDPSSDVGGEPKLPEGLFEKALAGPSDPRANPALLELIQHMIPRALMLIRAAFDETKPRRAKAPTTGQMRELLNSQHVPLPDDDPNEGDPDVRAEIAKRSHEAVDHATAAALASAAESFIGHWFEEFVEVRSLHDLALHLIRITYNRHQKRRRGDTRLERQAQSGNGAHAEGSFLVSQPDGREDPASEAELRDFLEIRRCLDDGVLEGFSVRDRQIIYLHVTGHGREEIVMLVNRHGNPRGRCTLNTVNHVIETFQAQLKRLEDEDDHDEEGRPNPGGNSDDDRDDERR
jgi:hypothetical protein